MLAGGLALSAYIYRHDLAHRGLERAVSGLIPGRLVLGEVTDVGLSSVTARDLTFETKDGTRVIALDEAEVHFDPAAFLSGDLEITRARVVGGDVWIEETEAGPIVLERAFSAGAPGGGEGPLIDIRSVQLAGLTVHLTLQGAPRFVVRDVGGALRIRRPPGGAVRLRLERITGVVRAPEALDGLELQKLEGFIRAQVTHVAHLDADARWGGEPLELGIDYYDREQPRVRLAITADALSKAGLAGLGLGVAQGFIDVLDVELTVSGL